MDIILVACTNVNWETLVAQATKYLNRSPTRSLDAKGIGVGSIISYLSTLSEFQQRNSDPRIINDFTLHHVSLSFVMIIPEYMYYDVLEKTQGLHFIRCQDYNVKGEIATIVTGTLYDWKQNIINVNIPEWSNKLWWVMQFRGFGDLLKDYKINEKQIIEKR